MSCPFKHIALVLTTLPYLGRHMVTITTDCGVNETRGSTLEATGGTRPNGRGVETIIHVPTDVQRRTGTDYVERTLSRGSY